MKNKRIIDQVLLAKSLILGTLVVLVSGGPSWAIDPADDVGVFGSISVAREAREGAKAIKSGDYGKALSAYNAAINLKSDIPEFYYGILYAGQKIDSWDQVNRALDAISEKDPAAKQHLNFEYGNCYTKTGRFDEAVPMLKAALAKKDVDNDFVDNKVKKLLAMTSAPAPPVILTPEQRKRLDERDAEAKAAALPPPKRPAIKPEDINPDNHKYGDNYLDAFLQSEWIGLCEYRGYQKKDHILFNSPPIANYHLVKWLKGPPLNKDMPIRYKFYEYDGAPKPDGWTFGPDKMPKIGSQWLIFVPQAVVREGAFDTYKGSYGRQEANDDNLGRILEIIESHHGQQ
jgi:tetratricopeptide (TPR) repeat protein